MTITLTIDSVDSLPDGGPIRYQARNRGFEIGRQQHLDWTLPDPSRYISGLHCDVRFEKGGYWLYDVSRNGTFLNGSTARVKSPYQLATGDRLTIGHYIIRVEIEDGAAPAPLARPNEDEVPARPQSFSKPSDDIWGTGEPAPPPIDRRELTPEPSNRRRAPDFSHQFLEFPDMRPSGEAARGRFVPSPFPCRMERLLPRAPNPRSASPVRSRAARRRHTCRQPSSRSRPSRRPCRGRGRCRAPANPSLRAIRRPPPGRPCSSPCSLSRRRLPRRPATSKALRASFRRLRRARASPPDTFAGRDPAEVGYEIGEFLKVSTEQLAQLLRARAAAKAMTKSSSRTMIGATDNNPLKFIPGASEAIDVMFSRKRPGFLGAKASLEAGFADLKRHEIATYAAMQKALDRLLDELSPEAIAAKVGNSAFSSKKSRSWELFVERWEQKAGPHDNGMLDVFFGYFAEAYDEANKKG